MNHYTIQLSSSSSELRHHGVKGMRWGVIREDKHVGRHRPTKEDKAQARKVKEKEEKAKREAKARKFEKKAKEQWDPERRDMYLREAQRARDGKLSRRQRQVILGAALVTAYATYKFVDSGEATRLISNGKAYLNKTPINNWARNEMLADKNMSVDDIMSKVVSRINDDYGKPGTMNNCRRCTFAYVQSRKGFDVSATKSMSATGQNGIGLYNAISDKGKVKGGLFGLYKELYKDNYSDEQSDFIQFLYGNKKDILSEIDLGQFPTPKSKAESVFKALSKLPERSTGELMLTWDIGGAHSVAWEVIDGKAVIFDTQSRKLYNNPELLEDLAKRMKSADYTRLDNLNFDPVMMGRWLKNAVPK